MSEEDTVRAPDQVDGKMDGDALIHPATDPATGNVVEEKVEEAAPVEAAPVEAAEAPADAPEEEKVNE